VYKGIVLRRFYYSLAIAYNYT